MMSFPYMLAHVSFLFVSPSPYMLAHVSFLFVSPRFPSLDSPNKWYQSRWFSAWALSRISVWTTVQVRGHVERECFNVEEGLSLEGEIVRYSSVSLSPTLSRNGKVEQHIRKKTRKPNVLRFWIGGGVIPLYVGSVLILLRSPRFTPSDSPCSVQQMNNKHSSIQ